MNHATERWFFVRMALLATTIAFVGFLWRYFLPLSAGTFHAPAIVHLHGLTMWSWTVLFLLQSWLAATGRLRHHRLFGFLGISILTLAVWTGTTVSLEQLAGRLARGQGDDARAFAALPLSLVALMSVLFIAAIVQGRRAETHARLMLLVTLVGLQPALARIVAVMRGGIMEPAINGAVAGVVVLLLISAAMVRDLRTRGRIHGAYIAGGLAVLAVQVARVTLVHTPAWHATVDALLVLVR